MNEPVTKELVIHKIKHNLRRLRTAIKWIIFSILSGLLIGMVGIAFYFGMTWVTDTRTAYPWLIFFLPLGGIVIVLLYHLLHAHQIPQVFQFDLFINKDSDKQTVYNGNGSCLGRGENTSIDTAKDDDRH